MSDAYYNFVVFFGRFPFWVSSRPTILNLDRLPRTGAFILASSHNSNYDVPVLMRASPRHLDFVTIVELIEKPFVGWFFRNMNAFPLERRRSDPRTVKVMLERLESGRVVAMFPEGRIRPPGESVVCGAPFRSAVTGLARHANVPIVPVVVWGAGAYTRVRSWLPWRRVRYGIAFGEPIHVTDEAEAHATLAQAYRDLFEQLKAASAFTSTASPGSQPPDSDFSFAR